MAVNSQPLGVIARLLDLTERRVQQLARDGVIPRAERGQYDLVGAVRGYVRFLREQASRAETGTLDFGLERARLVKAKADLAEMEAAQRRGELIPAPDAAAAWSAILTLVRARMLALPDKTAPLVFDAATIAEARDTLRKTVHEMLDDLATTEVEIVPGADRDAGAEEGGGDGAEGAGAAAGPQHQ